MADGAKNVGQVAGIWIGNVAPENTNIIWFDTNTSERRHKVYDFGQMKWVILNPQIVVPTTYNELVNTARQSGLSVGSMYKLTDMSNVLAYAVTTTKVQYNDNKGNIIVDDLGTGKEYHVSSSNLLIDGVQGVFDTATNQLIFSFAEDSFDEDTYVFGKKKINNVWKLVKSKISALISSQEGNSISWKNGFFFSFNAAINAILNKRGGVVGKTAYDKDMEEIAQDIENVGKENQRILSTAKKYTDDKTTDDEIFGKKITDDIADGQPIDVHKNMTLKDIVANFQRWLTRLRWATGVKLTRSFTNARTFQWVNNNDTVESAFGKVQYILQNFTDTLTMPGDFVQDDNVGDEQYIKDEKFRDITLRETFAKIIGFIFNIANHSRVKDIDLSTEYETNEPELKRQLNYLERNTADDGANSVITYSRKIYLQADTSSHISKLEDVIGLPNKIRLKYRNNAVAYDQWLTESYIRYGVSGPVIQLVETPAITNTTPGVYVKSVSPSEDGLGVDIEWGYNPTTDDQGNEVPTTVQASDTCSIYIKFDYLEIERELLLQLPVKRLFPGQSMDAEDTGINISIGKAIQLLSNFVANVTKNAHLKNISINASTQTDEDSFVEDMNAIDDLGNSINIQTAITTIAKYLANCQDNVHLWYSILNDKVEVSEAELMSDLECDREDIADSLGYFIRRILEFILNGLNNMHLNDEFDTLPDINDQNDATPVPGDSANNAFAKLATWFDEVSKHIVFDTWEYSKVTFDYSEQEIVDLKDKSLYAVMQLVASYLEDTWGNAHMNREHLTLPTVTDEADLIDQLEHKTGADNMGVNIYEAIGILASFLKTSLDSIHMPENYAIETWEDIKDFSIYDKNNWKEKSLFFVLSKLITLFNFGSRKIDISKEFAIDPAVVDETFIAPSELKEKSIENALKKIISFVVDISNHGHLNGTIKSYTVTDEADLLDQMNHTTGADAIGISFLEALSILTRFCMSIPNASHLADDWTPEANPTQASLSSMQSLSISDAIKRLAGVLVNAAAILKLADDWTPEAPGEGESLAQSQLAEMQSFTFSAAFSRIAAVLLDWSNILVTTSDQSYQGGITDASWIADMHDRNVKTVLGYILGYIKANTSAARLPSGWSHKPVTSNIALPTVGDNIDDVVAKIVGKLEQIGDISNGFIQSKATTGNGVTRKTVFDLSSAYLEFHSNNTDYLQLSGSRMEFKDGSDNNDAEFRADRLWMDMTSPYYKSYYWGTVIGGTRVSAPIACATSANNGQNVATIMGVNLSNNEYNYGGAFSSLLIGGHTFDAIQVGPGGVVTLNKYQSCVITFGNDSNDINIYLPANPIKGRMVYIVQSGAAKIIIHAQGNTQIDRRGSSSQEIEKNARGYMFTFIFTETTYPSPSVDGMWIVTSNDAE